MADEPPSSSPLSSPPESVIDVAVNTLDTIVESDNRIPSSTDHQDSTIVAAEGAAEQPISSPRKTITVSTKTTITPDEAPSHNSDDGGQSSAQKRKGSIFRTPAPVKKARRVVLTNKKSVQDKKWEAPFVYTDPKAPLAKADLRVRI
jgi:hypothetical protein